MKRSGVTLLEILLVVAVISILAALSLPLWSSFLQTEQVVRGADIIRAELGLTRVNAIREGEEYVFCYVVDTGQYWIEPLSATTQATPPTLGEGPTDELLLPPKNNLSPGVFFKSGQTADSTRSLAAEEDEGGASCERIIFFADGTAQDASVLITNEKDDTIQVTVRGITGTTSASGFIID